MDDLSKEKRLCLKSAINLTKVLLCQIPNTVESASLCMMYPDTLKAAADAVPVEMKSLDWIRRVVSDNDVIPLTRGLIYLAHCTLSPSLASECTSFTPIVLRLIFKGTAHINSGAPGAALQLLLKSVKYLGACARDPFFRINLVRDVVASVMGCWRQAPMTVARDRIGVARDAVLRVFEVALVFLFGCPTDSVPALWRCAATAMLDFESEFGPDKVVVLVGELMLHKPDREQEPYYESMLNQAVFLLVRAMIEPGSAKISQLVDRTVQFSTSRMRAACRVAVEHLGKRQRDKLVALNDAQLQHAREVIRAREALPGMLGVNDDVVEEVQPTAEHHDNLEKAMIRVREVAHAVRDAAQEAKRAAENSLRLNFFVLKSIPQPLLGEFVQQCGGEVTKYGLRLTLEQAVRVVSEPVSLKLAWHYADPDNASKRFADFLAFCLMCDVTHPDPQKLPPSAEEMCAGMDKKYLNAVRNVRARYVACELRPPLNIHEAKTRFEALYFDMLRFGGNEMTLFCVACLKHANQGVKSKRSIKPVPRIDEAMQAAQSGGVVVDYDVEFQKWMLHAFARAEQTGQTPDRARPVDCVQRAVEMTHGATSDGRVVVLHVGLGQKMTQAKKLHAMATEQVKNGVPCVAVHVEYNVHLILKDWSKLTAMISSGAHVLPMNVEALSVPFNPLLKDTAYVVTGWRMFTNRPLNVSDLFCSARRFPAIAFVMHEQPIIGLDTLDSPHYSGLALDCHVVRAPGAEKVLAGVHETAQRLLDAKTARRATCAKRKNPACAAQHGICLTKRRRKKSRKAML